MPGYFDPTSYQLPANLVSVIQPAPLALADADALAALMLNVSSYTAASDDLRPLALAQASDEIDRGMRWQGRKYIYAQLLEFPRVPEETGWPIMGQVITYPTQLGMAVRVWDWDYINSIPLVPPQVLKAVIYQANYILGADPAGMARRAAMQSGLKDQKAADLAESFDKTVPGSLTPLCPPAWQMVQYYRIGSGRDG